MERYNTPIPLRSVSRQDESQPQANSGASDKGNRVTQWPSGLPKSEESSQSKAGRNTDASDLRSLNSFSRNRASKGLQIKLNAPVGREKYTSYSSIANSNPFQHEDDIPLTSKTPQAYPGTPVSSLRMKSPPPPKLNLVVSNFADSKSYDSVGIAQGRPLKEWPGAQALAQVPPEQGTLQISQDPHYQIRPAVQILNDVRRSIYPEAPERLGILAASEFGAWKVWHWINGVGSWILTSARVQAEFDPRTLCPNEHRELIRLCEEDRDKQAMARQFEIVIARLDETRRIAFEAAVRASPHTKNPPRPRYELNAAQARGVTTWTAAPSGSPDRNKRGILKSPFQSSDSLNDRYSDISSRNVTFEMRPSKTGHQQGMPSELVMTPAARGSQGETHAASPFKVSPSADYQIVNSPNGPRIFVKQDLEVAHDTPKARSPANWKSHKQLRRKEESPEPGPFPWQKPALPERVLPFTLNDRFMTESWPPPLQPTDQSLRLPPPAIPVAGSSNSESPVSAMSLHTPSDEAAFAKKRPDSELSATTALLDDFPGRLGEELQSIRVRQADKNPATERFFGGVTSVPRRKKSEQAMNVGQQLERSLSNVKKSLDIPRMRTDERVGLGEVETETKPGEEATPGLRKTSTMARLTNMANNFINKNLKKQPGEIARKASNTILTSPSQPTPAPTTPRRRRSNIYSYGPKPDDEDSDDNLPKISVGPGDQMWLQGRVEFILNLTANHFLMQQKEADRLTPESVARIAKKWHNTNRPQPIEFMFDLQSQLELVKMNIDQVVFCGPRSTDSMAQESLLQAWRSVTRELHVRTFCLPDHALKKMMVDSFRIAEMLGADKEAFIEFRDIQRMVSDEAERVARQVARQKSRRASAAQQDDNGVTKRVPSPLLVSTRGIVNDEEEYYDDGIWKG